MTTADLPTLVLLPGMDGTGMLFEPLVEAIGDACRTIVVGYPGDEVLGYDDLVPRVRERLPVGEPFVLLGESFSGPIAIRLAAERPEGLVGLVLAATFATPPTFAPPWLVDLFAPVAMRFRPRLPFVRWLVVGRDASDATRDLVRASIGSVRPAVLSRRLREIARVDVRDVLGSVEVPVLDLRATEDGLVGDREARVVRSTVRVAPVDLPGPHGLLQAHPAAAWDAVRAFLESPGG
jgi:pimeloyl-ACP methyl ester carboxylesterase